MPDLPTIRRLNLEDVEDLVALASEIWHRHYPGIIGRDQIDYMLAQRYTPELIRTQVDDAHHAWWVVELRGKLAGFAHASLAGEYGKLDKLYVHPDKQRHGLGFALAEEVIRWTRGAGKHRLLLQVNRHNTLALSAYRKYGFNIIESRVCDIGSGYVMDDYFMELKFE
jgi:diamine N-acetyltransferase